jgi:hypothetical protein
MVTTTITTNTTINTTINTSNTTRLNLLLTTLSRQQHMAMF